MIDGFTVLAVFVVCLIDCWLLNFVLFVFVI